MKPLKEPGYVQKSRQYFHCSAAAGSGCCPVCGKFASVGRSKDDSGFRTQYRYCSCGHNFQTVIRLVLND